MWPKISSLLILTMLFQGCANTNSEPIYVVRCPVLVVYPPALQDKAAGELDLLPPDAATLQFIADYATLRTQCRAVQNAP